jgi:hypothetical protein
MADVQTAEVDPKLAPLKVGPSNFVCSQIFRSLIFL